MKVKKKGNKSLKFSFRIFISFSSFELNVLFFFFFTFCRFVVKSQLQNGGDFSIYCCPSKIFFCFVSTLRSFSISILLYYIYIYLNTRVFRLMCLILMRFNWMMTSGWKHALHWWPFGGKFRKKKQGDSGMRTRGREEGGGEVGERKEIRWITVERFL